MVDKSPSAKPAPPKAGKSQPAATTEAQPDSNTPRPKHLRNLAARLKSRRKDLKRAKEKASLATEGWREEKVFCRADNYFDELIEDIHQAQRTILLETYIFSYDSLGHRIIEALAGAAQRGVTVRVLMDGAGSYQSGHHAAAALEQRGIAVKIFHPLPWKTNHFRHAREEGPLLVRLFYFLRKINHRDHRKLCVIDNRWLWSGSLNISAVHLPTELGGENWRDYGVRVTGASVEAIASHFDYLWARRPAKLGRGLFKFYLANITDWTRRHTNQLLIDKIRQAERRVWISSAYFSPSSRVLRALRHASRRQVDIRLIVPSQSDVGFFPFLTATYYADLLKTGVRVFEYTPSMLHTKALLIDDFCLVGSTNFNHRSFLHDLELDLVLSSPVAKATLETSFRTDMENSIEITASELSWIKRVGIIGWIPRLLRYWL